MLLSLICMSIVSSFCPYCASASWSCTGFEIFYDLFFLRLLLRLALRPYAFHIISANLVNWNRFLQLGSIAAPIHGSFLLHCLMEILLPQLQSPTNHLAVVSLNRVRSIEIVTLGKDTALRILAPNVCQVDEALFASCSDLDCYPPRCQSRYLEWLVLVSHNVYHSAD